MLGRKPVVGLCFCTLASLVEEIVKASEAEEERRWKEQMRLLEERRRSSQIRISTQYSFPADREEQPEMDERDDWFNLLAVFPKESGNHTEKHRNQINQVKFTNPLCQS